MWRKILATALAGGTVTLAGCGDGVTPQSVAQQIGATHLHPWNHGPFAQAAAEATYKGRDVIIATFKSNEQRLAYIQMTEFGQKPLASGTGYAVFPKS